MARFLLGVNYWPRSSAMAMWDRFDPGEIDHDFARMAAEGLEVVRFFLLWEAFQPAPDSMAALAMERFVYVLDRLHAHRLSAMPTLFCGHMSGCNWLPAWTLDRTTHAQRFRTITAGLESPYGIGDFYGGDLLEAQRFFVREIGARARDHAAILAWDLGNEFSNLRAAASPAAAAHWSAALAHDLFEASNLPVTGGTHGEDLVFERGLRLSSLCEPWAFATMHGYPAYSAFSRGPDDPEVVPFLYDLTSSFARKPVLFSEFGTPVCPPGASEVAGFPCLDDERAAQYARAVLPRLQRRGALGAMWWCWTDYDEALRAEPPFDKAAHELRFGILRADGSARPVAAALAEFAKEQREIGVPPAPHFAEGSHYAGLPASVEREYREHCARYAEGQALGQ